MGCLVKKKKRERVCVCFFFGGGRGCLVIGGAGLGTVPSLIDLHTHTYKYK